MVGLSMFKCSIFLFALVTVQWHGFTMADDEPESSPSGDLSDEAFSINVDTMLQTACDAMQQSDPEQFKFNLTRPWTHEDVVKAAFWVKGKDLETGTLPMPDDITWRRDIVNLLYSVFTSVCPDLHIPHEYMNIMKELLMVYLNSLETRTSEHEEMWTTLKGTLQTCLEQPQEEYSFATAGLQVTGSNEVDSNGNTVPMFLPVQTELVTGAYPYIDLIVDNFWVVFSHAWGRCFPQAKSKDLWGPLLKRRFFEDFLEPLEDRWKNAGTHHMYYLDLIVGDYDVARVQHNLQYCLSSAYQLNNINMLKLIRPFKLADVADGVGVYQNHKLSVVPF